MCNYKELYKSFHISPIIGQFLINYSFSYLFKNDHTPHQVYEYMITK